MPGYALPHLAWTAIVTLPLLDHPGAGRTHALFDVPQAWQLKWSS